MQPRQLIEAWAQAVRDRDIEAIVAHHAEDFVMYDVTPPFQLVGLEAYRETWEPFFSNTKPGVFDIREIHIVADEKVAFAYAAMRCEDGAPGGYVPLDFRLTVGLEKVDGQWLIRHEHHSVPSQ